MPEPLPPVQDQLDHLVRRYVDLDRRLTALEQKAATLERGFWSWLFRR